MTELTVYIGYDPAEQAAYEVAEYTVKKYSTPRVRVVPLRHDWLTLRGLLNRPTCTSNGQMWDVLSDAPMSTEFAISRFLVPIIHQTGYALFMDCDMVVYEDVERILAHAYSGKAVYCVQHKHDPREAQKMCGKAQTAYARKNWSSVMLFDCDHPANRRLRLEHVNRYPGRELHRFCWLTDDEIGALPTAWNWLVGVQPKPDRVAVAHFTLGGPWLPGWEPAPYDERWHAAHAEMLRVRLLAEDAA